MKRLITIILAVVILFSLTITAYAETEGSLTITTTVVSNPPTWNLSIPADIDIPYKQTSTEIGTVKISDINNVDNHSGYVDIVLSYENLKSGENEIELTISGSFKYGGDNYLNKWDSESKFPYKVNDKANYSLYDHSASFGPDVVYPIELIAEIDKSDWEKAKPGTYSTTLTFTTQYGGYGVDYGI